MASSATKRRMPAHDLPAAVRREEIDSALESLERLQACFAGLAKAVNMTNRGELRAESQELLEPHNIAAGMSNLLEICANEMRLDLQSLRRQL